MTVISADVVFGKPTVTSKAYVTKGPSGWAEVFDRKKSDASLALFVAPVNVNEFVDLFVTQRELALSSDDRRVINWHTIVGFIARTMNCAPRDVPHDAAIALWGRFVVAQLTKDKATN
jgi:hypothetical protein